MSDTTETKEKKDLVKREVGERVDVILTLDPTLTKDLGDGVIEATITTSSVDRHMESIDTSGVDIENYMANPVVLYGHDYMGLPIGKTLALKQYKNKITARFQLAVKEYPFAQTVYDMIKGGYLNAISIGGLVRQWSEDYSTIEKMDMVEYSVVPVPANPEALITGRSLSKSLEEVTGKTEKEIHKEYVDALNMTLIDKAKALPHDEINKHIESLETLIGVLKAANADNGQSKEKAEVTRVTLRKAAAEVTKSGENIIKIVKKG